MKTLIFENKDRLYFTSDLHFGHKNIIDICNRPFKDIEEMDEILIYNWNSIIKNSDTVFILGDFCWKLNDKTIKHYISRLNGNKIFIKGNHDINEKPFPILYDGFVNIKVRDEDNKTFNGYQYMTLCHYPMMSWYQSHRGSWQLHGHWHNLNITPEYMKKCEVEYNNIRNNLREEHLQMTATRSINMM